ncbi:MAG TPA: class I SAM-dependent methyltransferase [Pyrinomonadaceae bacterium]|nr:class I SAM-dependent methyltransferase [Pyrinomonadaceae bacterium]
MSSNGKALATNKRSCPACGRSQGKARGSKYGFDLLTCNNCGTLYTPFMPEATGAEVYDNWYDPESSTVSMPAFIHSRLDEIVGSFSPYRKTNLLLDVGCGAGALLQAAARAGWDAEGQEISRTGCEYIRGLGIRAYHGDLLEAKYPSDRFDVVTASEVLEHLPDPELYVREIFRILRPGGLFWGTTPHGRGLSASLLGIDWSVVGPPDHLQLFSTKGIKILFAKSGFRRTRVLTQGMNPYEILEAWRKRRAANNAPADAEPAQPNFINERYNLNESFTKSPLRRTVKTAVNKMLSVSRQGDTLKIWAEK